MDEWGFDNLRLEIATMLSNGEEDLNSKLCTAYLRHLPYTAHMNEPDRTRFSELENTINHMTLDVMRVVFSTSNMAGHETLAAFYKPDIILVDDAGAGTDLDLAVPVTSFKESAHSVVLVGYKCQSPLLSVRAGQNSMADQKTIFERFTKGDGAESTTLDTVPKVFFFDE